MPKFEELKFMSIGANCADIGYLGPDRLRGPVDNMSGVKGILCFESLFNNTFLEEFKATPIQKPRFKNYEGDSDICYIYKSFAVCHNNPLEEKFIENLKKRYDNFIEFYSHIKEPNYYFTYSLNTEILKATHTIQNEKLLRDEISLLKNLGILNKTIFVGTRLIKNKGNWDFYSEDFQKKFPEVLYIEIIDLNVFNTSKSQEQFKQKIIKLLNLDN